MINEACRAYEAIRKTDGVVVMMSAQDGCPWVEPLDPDTNPFTLRHAVLLEVMFFWAGSGATVPMAGRIARALDENILEWTTTTEQWLQQVSTMRQAFAYDPPGSNKKSPMIVARSCPNLEAGASGYYFSPMLSAGATAKLILVAKKEHLFPELKSLGRVWEQVRDTYGAGC